MTASSPDAAEASSRRINPLAIAVFAVALSIGALLIWLSFAGDRAPEQAVVLVLQPPGGDDSEVLLDERGPSPAPRGPAGVIAANSPATAAPGGGPADDAPAAPGKLQRVGSLPPIPPGTALSPVPQSGLFEQTAEGGLLPIIAADGRRVVASYARPFEPAVGADGQPRPRIAVLIAGLGLNRSFVERALDLLPADISLAFTPYARDLQPMIAAARADGHEVAIELPMEPFDYPDTDPGPYALLTGLPAEANGKRLDWLLSRATGYFAAVNSQGGRYLSDRRSLAPTLEALTARGVGFIDMGEGPRSVTAALAPADLELAIADRVIDATGSPRQIDRALAALEAAALEDGFAFGVGMALPVTVERIADWAAGLESKGLQLVPASAAFVAGSAAEVSE